MNFMRKVVGGNRSLAVETGQHQPDNTLGLMHLRKLFADFRQTQNATQKELEAKLYCMLPLFCKVFGSSPTNDMTEKFGDILQFCSHVSRLMVGEIRRRASNQSTEAASCEIVKFLEIETTEDSSNGWMLLSAINLLSTGHSSLIDCMTAASLPSTLVKCLYLFFDLPDVKDADRLDPGCEFSSRERRILLQKVFVQVLVRLCSHSSPAEELARKDDLTLLFSAITSWCPLHNVPWRKSSAEVLMTLSRHGLTPNVVQYIHNKGCVALCIENMQRVQELSPIELVEMFVTVFCFLKDSSEVSQILLDDFRSCQGYVFLSEFLLKMEQDGNEESIQALRNLVLLVGSLTTCGFIELKPSTTSSGSLFQMPGFIIPQPAGKGVQGVSVRNLQAFQVLQTVFIKSQSVHLCSTILDVISSIYHQDNANYFILESQCTLSQFAERIHIKHAEIQNKFFEIVEFVVFNLNYVPCKELISLSILIKTNHSTDCSMLCVKTLLRILRHHNVYKDVFREVGLLEVMVTCLHRYAALLKEPTGESKAIDDIPPKEQEMGFLVMDALTLLLNGNSQNAGVFRECGGARCSHNMVPYPQCRFQALTIVQQLVVSNGGDDDMGTLLGLMHTAPTTALELKTHILKSLLNVLRESHRTRTVFRKVGGFVYVMSVLVSMEGCLADPPKSPWDTVSRRDVILLLKTVFSTLTVAMRFEPANAKFFATEVRYSSLTEAVRLLGCFSIETEVQPVPDHLKPKEETEFSELFCKLREQKFESGDGDPQIKVSATTDPFLQPYLTSNLPRCLISATMMLRYLYDMALDNFDKQINTQHSANNSPNLKRMSSVLESSTSYNSDLGQPLTQQKRASTGSLTLTLVPTQPDPVVVHAGAVISMLHLVPGITCDNEQVTIDLQYYICEVLKSLMRSERNQQVMCEAGLPHELLARCNLTLAKEIHVLHPPMQYMFERLSAQYLTPKDLRDFLRLGDPLCCAVEQEPEPERDISCPTYAIDKPHLPERRTLQEGAKRLKNGGPVPLTRVKCLVSMTTPRDVRLHGASITPAFVEFDMSAEGFGCLYLPSIAPQGPPTPSVVGAGMIGGSDPGVVGGIGTGERMFPPQAGMTYSSWICVDKYSSPVADPHAVRLLTIVRSVQNRDDNLICLSVYLAPRDRALFVSTQETHMPSATGGEQLEMEPILNDTNVRFWCPELTQEGQWRHVTLVFNRAGIMKNSSVSLYVDGQHVSTQKLHYLSPNIGGGGTAPASAATSVFTYIGSPPQLRRLSKLVWRQGPAHLFEDVMSPNMIQFLYQLGPNYVGSFQAPIISNKKDAANPLISEDKVIFGVHAHAMSLMTIAKIRKVYNKTDAKSIAKQLGMSAHENATPIRILHNSCGHLSGPARSFGSILMGYLGVRTFCPRPVAKMVLNVGGVSALLGLIAMAADVEGLYAAVKALVCVVRSNKNAQREMTRTDGYKMLAVLYRKKRDLLNSHILHLTFSLVGTVDSGRESTVIPNKAAFEDLLCDLEVWHVAPGDLQRSLYEHFYELLTESSEQKSNLRLMQDLGLVLKLLHILKDETLSHCTVQTVASVISVLLAGGYFAPSLLRFGQFMVSTLPNFNQSEKGIALGFTNTLVDISKPSFDEDSQDGSDQVSAHKITLRNSLLEMLLRLLTTNPTTGSLNVHACEEMQRVLGFDWLQLFLQGNLHHSTVVLTMRLLCQVLDHPGTMQKFREGVSGGGWLRDTECVLQNRVGTFMGFRLSASGKEKKREINKDMCHIPGFQALQYLLPRHAETPELYFLLMTLLLGQPVKNLPERIQFDLDSMWTYIYGVPANKSVQPPNKMKRELNVEAACVVLAMIRAMLNQSSVEDDPSTAWLQEYPVTLMQFLLYLYHNQSDFVPLCMSAEFLCGLAATLFPYRVTSDSESELSSPMEDFKPFPESDSMVLVDATEKVTSKSVLTCHPARKFVMDFLRMIIVDSFSMPQSGKSAPVIDVILEASPEHASRLQQKEFQTEVLSNLMEHLLAADALLGDQAALPVASSGNYTHTANNIFYFTQRVVDKLWQGIYLRDTKEVFEFVSKLISQAKMKASGISLDPVYRCLNRAVLYQLSRRLETVADQMSVLDALHKLTSNRNLVFGPGNYDQEFIGCLCYCLIQLIDDPSYISDPAIYRKTTWHCDPDPDQYNSQYNENSQGSPSMGGRDGLKLVANAARRVWEELYIHKKPTIEEVFKVAIGKGEAGTTPDLSAVKPQIQEAAARIWVTYYENERKCNYSNTERLQNQLQSKLQKVGHGVTGVLRLASRASRQKKDVVVKASPASLQDTTMWTLTHVSIVKDLVEFQHRQYNQSQKHMEKYLLDKWTETEKELMRERGLWGPPVGSELDKWMLDMTEGPCRMRKKLMKNELFYVHYPHRPEISDCAKPSKHKAAISKDSKDYFERYRSQSLVGEDSLPMPQEDLLTHLKEIAEEGPEPESFTEMPMNIPCLLPRPARQNSMRANADEDEPDLDSSVSQDNEDGNDGDTNNTDGTDYQKVLRLLEEGDKLTHMYRCARCQGLDTVEGLLLFGKDHFYVVDGFTLLKSREIVDIDSLPTDLHDPIIPKATKSSTRSLKNMCSKFAYEDIREVHKRRYLLQPIAIEVFSADGRNYLLAFPRKIRNKVHTRFLQCATSMLDSAHESVSGQKSNAKVEPGTGIISSLIGEKSVTQRWERGEISNFEYLMCLNTLAGRSYNDLMQYPVFPWIVADYEAEELDLTNPASFRDLSKPMGAQTPDRLKQFQKRYTDWDDPQGETPPYHYGTHYSSAMIVASFLLRMEPFTQHFLRLQGGHFDLADRMFHSVKECWLSASKHNMADVRELIPEFFYLPEFLVNSNNFDLGAKQSGVSLNHVVLPTWAKGDPREFIRGHREALECDYVSAHLHEWIDLIFGYKQFGNPAVDAVNVFHHLFYEGNVDIFSIDDPLKKNATIGFINNFGQIPKQLFKKPHPQKKLNARSLDILPMVPLVNVSADKLFFNNLDNLKPTMQPIKELKGPVGNIVHYERTVLAVEQNKVLIQPNYNKYLSWGFSDLSVRVGNYDSDKASAIYENLDNGEILCAACPNARTVVTAGTSTVVNVWEFSSRSRDKKALTLKQPLYGHTEPVICLAASSSYNIIVSGSRDRTCILWDLSRLVFVRQLRGHAAPVAAVCINELTGDIATCAGTYLHVWSVNGDEMASINTATSRNQQILCVAMSHMMEWSINNVIMTGNSDGVVRMWSVEFVQVLDESKQKEKEGHKVTKPPTSSNAVSAPKAIPVLKRASSSVVDPSPTEDVAGRLQEFKDPGSRLAAKEIEFGSSAESDGGNAVENLREHLDRVSQLQQQDLAERASLGSNQSSDDLVGYGREPTGDVDSAVDVVAILDTSGASLTSEPSKDQTSPTSDFVFVTENEVKDAVKSANDSIQKINPRKLRGLREGFRWQKQLVFRSKLTMHTAFERKDNKDPAAITAIAVSKDHRIVYVGDAKGRVFSWTVTDQPGRVVADHWIKDEGMDGCVSCGVKFSFSERRHHCRNCGQLFCSKCSRFEAEIKRLRIMKPVRVCQGCHTALKVQQYTEQAKAMEEHAPKV